MLNSRRLISCPYSKGRCSGPVCVDLVCLVWLRAFWDILEGRVVCFMCCRVLRLLGRVLVR